jgi:hypothetical protein
MPVLFYFRRLLGRFFFVSIECYLYVYYQIS